MARKRARMGRKEAKKKAALCGRGLCLFMALDCSAWWLVVAVAVFLKRDLAFDIVRKGVRLHEIAMRQIFVTLRQILVRNLRKFAPVFDDVSI